MKEFNIKVYDTGVVITPLGLGEGEGIVFERENKEKIMLELYHRIFDWKVGDKIIIKSKGE